MSKIDTFTASSIQTAYESALKCIKSAKTMREEKGDISFLDCTNKIVQDEVIKKLKEKGYKIQGYDVIF